YRDTQLSRLGTPNFHQIPINRPVAESHNNQRDGYMQTEILKSRTAYFPNTLGGGCPHLSKISEGAFSSYAERIDAQKIRTRSKSFNDHFSQPALFYRSLAAWEKAHVVEAYSFELGKCTHKHIQQRMLWLIQQIDIDLAKKVSGNLGVEIPEDIDRPINQAIGKDVNIEDFQPGPKKDYLDRSRALSQANTKFESIATRQIAVLAADGFDMESFGKVKKEMEGKNAVVKIVAHHGGTIKCNTKMEHAVDASINTTESVLYDAIYIPGGEMSIKALGENGKFIKFINEALKHCKAIAVSGEGEQLLDRTYAAQLKDDKAILRNSDPKEFIKAIAHHRNWDRLPQTLSIPA